MKHTRITALLFAAMMVFAADAQASASQKVSIADIREEVKDGWHQTYDVNGRSIVVDIDILVPDVQTVPIVRIGFPPPLMPHSDTVTMDTYVDGTGVGVEAHSSPDVFQGEGDSTEIVGDDAQAENNPLSRGEARELLEAIIRQYESQIGSLGLELHSSLAQSRTYKRDQDSDVLNLDEPTSQMGAYYFQYCQLFHGIRYMQFHPFDLAYPPQEGMASPSGIVGSHIATKDDYILSFRPAIEVGVIADDTLLVPFSTIKGELEKLILAGHVREVYEVRLIYYCYVDRENPGQTFVLEPVWRLRGVIARKAGEPDPEPPEFDPEYTKKYTGFYAAVEALSGELLGEKEGWEYADPSYYENQ